jgi:hypothetical protein
MPVFEVTYSRKYKSNTLTDTVKVRAIGETHARKIFFEYAKNVLKKFVKIISIIEK